MKANELRGTSRSELTEKLNALSNEYFLTRMQISNGINNKTHRLKILRKQIACVKTIINEKR